MRWLSDPLLVAEGLTMRFGGLVAVRDLSFSVGRGDITALIGPNGAGKTTVFNCITGFYKPTSGLIALSTSGPVEADAVAVLTASSRRYQCRDGSLGSDGLFLLERMPDFEIASRARVARTFQNVRLFPGMTVLENLIVAQHNPLMRASGLSVLGLIGAASFAQAERGAVELARYWLDRIELTHRADDAAGALPYGDQRRLEIARAMCTEPVLLCLDEPAAGLNPRESAGAQHAAALDPRRARHVDSAHRARHVGGHGDFRSRRRPRIRAAHLRRNARERPQRPESRRRLSRRRG